MSPRQRRLVLAGVAAAAFVGPFSQTAYVPSLPEIGRAFDVGAVAVNLTISLFVGVLAVSGFVIGPLADRRGRRATLLPGLVLFCIGSLMCLLAPGYLVFLLGRVVQAAGISAGVAMAAVVIGDLYEPVERPAAMSVYQLLTFLGPVAGPVVGGFMAQRLPWQWVFGLLIALGLAVLAYNAWVLPETRPAGAGHGHGGGRAALAAVARDRPALAVMGVAFAQFYGYYTFLVFLPGLLGDRFHLGVAERGLGFVPLTAGLLVGISSVRLWASRWTRRAVVTTASAAIAIDVLLQWALLATGLLGLPLLMATLGVYGLLVGGSLPAQTTILVNVSGERRGTAVGLYNSVRFTGAALGPLAAAWIDRGAGDAAVFGLLGLALAAAALATRAHVHDPQERVAPGAAQRARP